MNERLQVVVVTGASAGVGRATAVEFARDGAAVALIARSEERLRAAAREVERAGGRALALPADVGDSHALHAAAEEVVRNFGGIDIWVNSAMATVFAPVSEITPEEFDRVTRTTYLGTVYGTMAALRQMEIQGRGTIVQVGSSLAYRSIPLQAAYCGAKAAIRGFTDALRTELIHDRSPIRLSMVQLGAVNTPQFDWARNRMGRRPQPVPPIYQPEVAARAIVWAAAHPHRELSVGSASVMAKLGQRLLPGWMDRYMARNAWEGQMTPARNVRSEDNLFRTVSDEAGSHGRFDDQARKRSLQFELNRRRGAVAATAVAAAAAVAGWWQYRSENGETSRAAASLSERVPGALLSRSRARRLPSVGWRNT